MKCKQPFTTQLKQRVMLLPQDKSTKEAEELRRKDSAVDNKPEMRDQTIARVHANADLKRWTRQFPCKTRKKHSADIET
jgi:hypothetical protein